jgi:hypothetical protein
MKISNYNSQITNNKQITILSFVICLVLVSCVLLFAPCSAYALSETSQNITVTVFIQGEFAMTINTDSFDFVGLTPGQTGEMSRDDGVNVVGDSTNGNPWYLKVATARPLSSGQNSIPNENFTWYGTSEGQGEWRGTSEKDFASSDNTAYISTAPEADEAAKVLNRFKFRLNVPEDTKPGEYTTVVMFTMTE